MKGIAVVVVTVALLAGVFVIGRTTAPTAHRQAGGVAVDARHRVYCPGATPRPFVAEATVPGPVRGCRLLTAHDGELVDSLDYTNRDDLPVELCNEDLVELRSTVDPGCRRVTLRSGSTGLVKGGYASDASKLNGITSVDADGSLSRAVP